MTLPVLTPTETSLSRAKELKLLKKYSVGNRKSQGHCISFLGVLVFRRICPSLGVAKCPYIPCERYAEYCVPLRES